MASRLARILDGLEKRYGKPRVGPASDPYEMLVVATCGYPASEPACAKGFAALREHVGVAPADVLRAPRKKLVLAMRAGGIVPELRAERLREIASRVTREFEGDLKARLSGSQGARANDPQTRRPLCEQCPVTRDCAYFAKLPGAGPQNVPSACIP